MAGLPGMPLGDDGGGGGDLCPQPDLSDTSQFRRELFAQLSLLQFKLDSLADRLPAGDAAGDGPTRSSTLLRDAAAAATAAPKKKLLAVSSSGSPRNASVVRLHAPSPLQSPRATDVPLVQEAALPPHFCEEDETMVTVIKAVEGDPKLALALPTRAKSAHTDRVQSMFGEEVSNRQIVWGADANKAQQNLQSKMAQMPMSSFAQEKVREASLFLRVSKTVTDAVEEDPSKRRGWNEVHSVYFQMVVSAVIVMNAITFGCGADQSFKSSTGEPEAWQQGFTVFFMVFFVLELVLRVIVERLLFIIGQEWKWNLLDSILVIESVFSMSTDQRDWNTTIVRVMRMARFIRLTRITRVARHLSALRLVLFAMLDSMSSLFWCFMVVGIVTYVFATVFVAAAAEYTHHDVGATNENIDLLRYWYGGVMRAMISLFMVISGGADWHDIMQPLKEISFMYEYLFIFFVFIMQFGILNIVVGTFVAKAQEVAMKDRESMVTATFQKVQENTSRIRTFFHEADVDRSGTLSWLEFEEHMQSWKVKAYFQALDLDISQAHVLFQLLDTDNGGGISIDEFIDGCLRLKGEARSIDLHVLTYITERLQSTVADFIMSTAQRFDAIQNVLTPAPVAAAAA